MHNTVETHCNASLQKFKNIFRIPTNRLPGWDYLSSGYYFVTICTYKKKEYFGEIVNGKMNLSEIGKVTENELLKTEQIRQNVKIDEYGIMPNHVHAIIVIHNTNAVETSRRDVSTNKWQLRPSSLGSIIGQYKSIVTKRINRELKINFHWQSRYFDHIIRTEPSYLEIKQYIRNNPQNWSEDKYNGAL